MISRRSHSQSSVAHQLPGTVLVCSNVWHLLPPFNHWQLFPKPYILLAFLHFTAFHFTSFSFFISKIMSSTSSLWCYFIGSVVTEFKLHCGYVSETWEVISRTLEFIMKFETRLRYENAVHGNWDSGFQTSCASKRLGATPCKSGLGRGWVLLLKNICCPSQVDPPLFQNHGYLD